MNLYKITISGKGSNVSKGNTPLDAFHNLFPAYDLIAVKNRKDANTCIELLNGKRKTCNYYVYVQATKSTKKPVTKQPVTKQPEIVFTQSDYLRLAPEIKKQIIQLCTDDLVLLDFDYADITNVQGGSALIVDLKFNYQTNKTKGVLELGDVPFEYYYDDGDICIDLNGELYLLDADNDFSFDKEKPKGFKSVKTKFQWDKFYQELMDACDY